MKRSHSLLLLLPTCHLPQPQHSLRFPWAGRAVGCSIPGHDLASLLFLVNLSQYYWLARGGFIDLAAALLEMRLFLKLGVFMTDRTLSF